MAGSTKATSFLKLTATNVISTLSLRASWCSFTTCPIKGSWHLSLVFVPVVEGFEFRFFGEGFVASVHDCALIDLASKSQIGEDEA